MQETRVNLVADYLYQKGFGDRKLFESANAVRKAAGEVACYQRGQLGFGKYSNLLNRRLNEGLMAMCCDRDCDTRNIRFLKDLIKEYHEMHGLPEVEVELPVEIPSVAPALQGELGDEAVIDDIEPEDVSYGEDDYCAGESIEDCILNSVQLGEYVSFKNLSDEMSSGPSDDEMILNALKELVRSGYFEVVAREPYNGTISTCIRVK